MDGIKEHQIERRLEQIEKSLGRILHVLRHLNHPQLTRAIAVRFTGESVMPNNALTLNVGQTSQASIQPLLADGVTPSGGTLSVVSYTFNDPSATVVLNADGLTAKIGRA